MGDTWVMTALDREFDVFFRVVLDRFLRFEDRSCRLDHGMDQDRHSIRNAAIDARVVVGSRLDPSILRIQGVIGFASFLAAKSKPRPKLTPLTAGMERARARASFLSCQRKVLRLLLESE